jgi:hypothetical protein
MIKKLLIGCGLITLFLIIVVSGLAIYITMKVKDVQHSWKVALEKIDVLEDKYPFALPDEGAIDLEKFEEYLVIRNSISTEFSANPTINKLTNSSAKVEDIGFFEIAGLATSFAPTIIEEFADLLDDSQMPPSEYAFYVRVAYSTVSEGSTSGDKDMDEIYEFLDNGIDEINSRLAKLDQGELQIPFSATILSFEDGKNHVSKETTSTLTDHQDEFMEWPGMCFVELMVAGEIKPGEKNSKKFKVPTKFGGIALEEE